MVVHAFQVWALSPGVPLLALGLGTRRHGVAAVGVVACGLLGVRSGLLERPLTNRSAETLSVGTANALFTNPHPEGHVRALLAMDLDIVLVQEVTPGWRAALEAEPDAWPHRIVQVDDGPWGVAILSRLPLHDAGILDLEGVPAAEAWVEVDGRPLHLLSSHVNPPFSAQRVPAWKRQVEAAVDWVASGDGDRLLGGDLNLSRYTPLYQTVSEHGVVDLVAQAGGRGVRTWPGDPLPSLIGLDHLLARGAWEPVSLELGASTGSDHRPVRVGLRRRR